MPMTDPIADFLTRIRNAIHAAQRRCEIPASKLKTELAKNLVEQGSSSRWSARPPPGAATGQVTEIRLNTPTPPLGGSGLQRVSRPGSAPTCRPRGIPKVLGGMDLIVSTCRA